MITAIWAAAALVYALFYGWYVGFGRKLSAAEIDRYCRIGAEQGVFSETLMRKVLEEDTGREFFMVNLLKIHRRVASGETGLQVLARYQKPFLGGLLRRAGHPIVMARAASVAVECWGIENAEHWDAAVLVRYRSRRDMAEIVSTAMFRDQHPYKLQAVEKTFAFMGDPARLIFGGPKLVVPLMLFSIAAGLTLLLR